MESLGDYRGDIHGAADPVVRTPYRVGEAGAAALAAWGAAAARLG